MLVVGSSDVYEHVLHAIGLLRPKWRVEHVEDANDIELLRAEARRTDGRVVILVPLGESTWRQFTSPGHVQLEAAMVPYRETSDESGSSGSVDMPSDSRVLCLSRASPAQLVRAFEEALDRWSHSRALQNAAAEEGDRDAQTEFLAAVNHEVRTPLNAILGMAEALSEEHLASNHAEMVRIIRSSGHDLLHVLEQLVDLARLRGGGVRSRPVEVDLAALLHATAEEQSMSIHRKGLGLSVRYDDALPRLVMTDPRQISQIVSVLIRNALRLTSEGEIAVSALPDPRWECRDVVRVGVRHTGDPIQSDLEANPGVDSVRISREFSGLGIGLALADGLVRSLSGELSVEDDGRTIWFSLPVAPRAMQRGEADCSVTLHGLRVLLLSSNETERSSIANAAVGGGALVSQAIHVEHAVEAIYAAAQTERAYEILIVDERFVNETLVAEIHSLEDDAPKIVSVMHGAEPEAKTAALRERGVQYQIATPATDAAIRETIGAIAANEAGVADMLKTREPEGERKLLLVDDSPENRKLVTMYLRDADFEIHEAENGVEAVELFEAELFDVVLMDIQMPGMNGYQATEAIRAFESRENRPAVPIIALTAFSMDEDREMTAKAGCTAHLNKPVEKQDLLDELRLQLAKADSKPATRPGDELEHEIIALQPAYLERRLADVALIRRAPDDVEWEEILIAGHRMAGSASGYGFPALHELGVQIEAAAKAQDLDVVCELANDLEERVAELQQALEEA